MAESHVDRRLVRDSLGVFGAQIAMTVVGVVTGAITARVLGPHDRGLFQLLTVVMPLTLSNFVKLGIPQANVYFMRRRGASASDVASNSLWLSIVLGGVVAVVCYVQRDWILSRFLSGAPPVTLIPVLLLLPFVVLQAFFQAVLQAQERFREYSMQILAPNVFALVGMAIALLWLRSGLVGAVITQTVIIAGVTVWLSVRVNRVAPIRFTWNPRLIRGMLSFGTKSWLQTLASTLHLRIDQIMIAYLIGATPVGYYSIAVNLTNLLIRIPDATGTVLFPRLAGARDIDAHEATARVCRTTLFITVSVALGYATLGPLAIRLIYGSKFIPSIRPMLLMLPGIVMFSLYMILTRNFTSRNKQQVNIIAAFSALAINVGCNWVLIPRWGISGAAISTAISYSIAALFLLAVFVRDSGHSVRETVLVERRDVENLLRLATGKRRATPVRAPVGLRPPTIPDTSHEEA
jgi:O-antigen/teichoic acid export membrane protein